MRQHPRRFLSLLLPLLLFACSQASSSRLPLSSTIERFAAHSSRNPETSWSCTYPLFSGTPGADAINADILATVTGTDPMEGRKPNSPSEAAALFIGDYDDYHKEEPGALAWYCQSEVATLLNRSGYLTIELTASLYTGGAHGMYGIVYSVFETENGKRLALSDLLLPGFGQQLDSLIDKRFRAMKGVGPDEPLNGRRGGLFENRIVHTDNVALTDKGLTFLYNPYEIAPYAEGITAIELPWKELYPLLTPAIRAFAGELPQQGPEGSR